VLYNNKDFFFTTQLAELAFNLTAFLLMSTLKTSSIKTKRFPSHIIVEIGFEETYPIVAMSYIFQSTNHPGSFQYPGLRFIVSIKSCYTFAAYCKIK
jgi:hypothetical protein